MGILEKIQEVEREIARTQKNKGVSLKGSICVELYKTNNVVIQHYFNIGSQLVNSCMLFC